MTTHSGTLRVALFHATLPERGRKLGGVEVAVHHLANALAGAGGCEVTVFSLSPCPEGAQYRHRRLFPHLPWLKASRLARLLVLPLLLNFVSFREFDLLHLHGDDWFFLRRTLPTVRTFHGSALCEARTASSWQRRIIQFLVYPLERFSVGLCDVALALGEQTAVLYRIQQPMDNGVDLEQFHPGPKAAHPLILFVGTWEGRKRGRFLFERFVEDVLPQFPDAQLCMVSDQCPAHPNVIFEQFPPDEVLAQRYREAWVFAYPSLYEGFGLAYLEAMASGTAIVCSPNEGADHVLAGGQYGVMAEDAGFGASLCDLLANQKPRDRLAIRGQHRVRGFTWAIIAARHRTLYADMLQRQRRTSVAHFVPR